MVIGGGVWGVQNGGFGGRLDWEGGVLVFGEVEDDWVFVLRGHCDVV